MKLTDQYLTVFFFLFLLFATQIAAFGQAEVLSDSLEVITEDDSVGLGEGGFQEVVQEKFIEGSGWSSFYLFFYFTGMIFWIAVGVFLVYRILRFVLKLVSTKR